jgi:hypothetical protein
MAAHESQRLFVLPFLINVTDPDLHPETSPSLSSLMLGLRALWSYLTTLPLPSSSMTTLSSILALQEAHESLSVALVILLAFLSPILLFAPVGMVAEH